MRWGIWAAVAVAAVALAGPRDGAKAEDVLPTCSPDQMFASGGGPLPALDTRVISLPGVGVETTAEVGQSMLLTGKLSVYGQRLYLRQPVTLSEGSFVLTIPAGVLTFNSASPSQRYYVATRYQVVFKNKPRPDMLAGIMVPADPSKPWKAFADGRGIRYDFEGPVNQEGSEVRYCTRVTAGGFQRELVYSGGSQGTVSLLYREYSDDVARPAFTQQLTYDLAAGNEIGFRGARIKILAVTNIGVKYVVERGFDGAAN